MNLLRKLSRGLTVLAITPLAGLEEKERKRKLDERLKRLDEKRKRYS